MQDLGRAWGRVAIQPTIHPTAVLMPGSQVIGRVTVGAECFIGPNAVLRGDIEPITLGRGTNVQDNCTIHTHAGNPVRIGDHVSVGHGAIVHGATVEDRALIGMNAVVLDKAVVGTHSVVGALTLVPQGMVVPPRSLAVGIPARIVKQDDPKVADMAFHNAERYLEYRRQHESGAFGRVLGR